MRPFRNFQFSRPDQVPPEIRMSYALPGNPWGKGVFDYHENKLPLLSIVNAASVPCAYCQNPVTRCNSEIDHLVPVKTYARYKAYCAPTSADIETVMRAANSDPDNLVIACVPCNQSKKMKIDVSDLVNSGNRFFKFKQEYGFSSKAHMKFKIAVENIANMSAHKDRKTIFSDIATRGDRATGYSDRQKGIQTIAISLFTRSRPAFTVPWEDLAHQQGVLNYNITGRACPYCLGIFHSGMELDHVNPKAHTQAMNVTANYNNPLNLIVVCASCNSAKGTRYLDRSFLDNRIKFRQDSGIAGCELFDTSIGLKDTRSDQNRIFGL